MLRPVLRPRECLDVMMAAHAGRNAEATLSVLERGRVLGATVSPQLRSPSCRKLRYMKCDSCCPGES
jgi:hypothetical protein